MTREKHEFENNAEYLEKVRNYFSADAFAFNTIGIQIVAAAPGHCQLELQLDSHLVNAKGGVQGGVLFTMADLASAIADYAQDEINTTVDASIRYLSVPKGDVLWAYAESSRKGRSIGFYEVSIYDNLDMLVATASITLMHRAIN